MRLKNTFVLATIGAMLCAATAMAAGAGNSKVATIESATSGSWNNTSTWVGSTIPGSGDAVIINSNHVVTVNQAVTILSLQIEADAEVDFEQTTARAVEITGSAGLDVDPVGTGTNPGKLNINFQDAGVVLSGGGTHTVDGDLIILSAGASLEITGNNSTFSGASTGSVRMDNQTAAIRIDSGLTFKIDGTMVLQGDGQVVRRDDSGDATFVNSSTVLANDNTLVFGANVVLDDDGSTDKWEANGGTMKFNRDAPMLDGTFELNNSGVFHLLQGIDISTSASLNCNSGTVDLDTGGGDPASFEFDRGDGSTVYTMDHTCP